MKKIYKKPSIVNSSERAWLPIVGGLAFVATAKAVGKAVNAVANAVGNDYHTIYPRISAVEESN